MVGSRELRTVICILFCTTNFREHYLVVLQFDIFGQEKVWCLESGTNQAKMSRRNTTK